MGYGLKDNMGLGAGNEGGASDQGLFVRYLNAEEGDCLGIATFACLSAFSFVFLSFDTKPYQIRLPVGVAVLIIQSNGSHTFCWTFGGVVEQYFVSSARCELKADNFKCIL